jgi:hypothetical protein
LGYGGVDKHQVNRVGRKLLIILGTTSDGGLGKRVVRASVSFTVPGGVM